MRQVAWALVLAGFGVLLLPSSVFAWGEAVAQPATAFTENACHGSRVLLQVAGEPRAYRSCIMGSASVRIATYTTEYGYNRAAISVASDSQFYPFDGVCAVAQGCAYSVLTDSIMQLETLATGKNRLVVLPNITTHLTQSYSGGLLRYSVPASSKQPALAAAGGALPIGAVALSANGRYVAAELPNTGIVLLDLLTLQARQVMAPGYLYGLGRDPSMVLAVDNAGQYIAVMGRNAGPLILEVSQVCGEVLGVTPVHQFSIGVVACKKRPITFSNMLAAVHQTGAPQFSADASQLFFSMRTIEGSLWWASVRQPTAQASAHALSILALGDSFISGEGELDDSWYQPFTNQPPDTCHTSFRSYPYLVAQQGGLSLQDAFNIACSGAVTQDILGAGDYQGQKGRLSHYTVAEQHQQRTEAYVHRIPGRVAQSDFVMALQPTAMVVSIGGNDTGFMQKLKACIMPDTCRWAAPGEARLQVAQEIEGLLPRLVETYTLLRQQAPTSTLYAMGYPLIMAVDGACSLVTDLLLNRDERLFIHEAIQLLNNVIRTAAARAGAYYVDNEKALVGHELCSNDPTAMNGLRIGDDIAPIPALDILKLFGNESFHPTPDGHRRIAQRIVSQYPTMTTMRVSPLPTTVALPPLSDYWQQAILTEPPRLQATDEVAVEGAALRVTLPAGSFAPHSLVSSTLYSEPVELARQSADNAGALFARLTLPEDTTPGYHTVVMNGTSYSGEPIALYQTIAIPPPAETTGDTEHTLGLDEDATPKARQGEVAVAPVTNTVAIGVSPSLFMQGSYPRDMVHDDHGAMARARTARDSDVLFRGVSAVLGAQHTAAAPSEGIEGSLSAEKQPVYTMLGGAMIAGLLGVSAVIVGTFAWVRSARAR